MQLFYGAQCQNRLFRRDHINGDITGIHSRAIIFLDPVKERDVEMHLAAVIVNHIVLHQQKGSAQQQHQYQKQRQKSFLLAFSSVITAVTFASHVSVPQG